MAPSVFCTVPLCWCYSLYRAAALVFLLYAEARAEIYYLYGTAGGELWL